MRAATTEHPAKEQKCAFGPIVVSYDHRVLAPRHWTLLHSEWAADVARHTRPGPLLELFAGVGHIGLVASLLADRPIVQVEVDPTAAAFAIHNASRAGRANYVDVRNADVSLAIARAERFPVILADPPYLPTGHLDRWPDDPAHAIDGGPDGLAQIPAVLRLAGEHLDEGGWLLLQAAGEDQVAEVIGLAHRLTPQLSHSETRCYDAHRAVVAFRLTRLA